MTTSITYGNASFDQATRLFKVQLPTLVLIGILAVIIGSVDLYAQAGKRKPALVKRDTNDAQAWITRNIDEMEEDTSYYSKEYVMIPGLKSGHLLKVAHYFHKTSDYYSTSIYAYGAGKCIAANARILYLFTDGTKLEVVGYDDFNCENRVRCSLSDEELAMFIDKTISKVRVYTYTGSIEASLTPESAREWRVTLRHLAALKGS